MFDAMLKVLSVNTSAPTDEEIAAGAVPMVVVTLTTGLALPFADPQDPGKPMVIPDASYRFHLDGDVCAAIGSKMVEAGKRLPKPSRLLTASSLAGAEDVAAQINSLRG